ncbi:MAG TPA: PVC-type heme-binding CxxCH protein [Gemmataceae bacterium]|jgi:putative membrane-bound dehydrogenase-like protein|nr:PVC-type heme-binding CxxCH protein [Gemmataceae bacterium]
MTHKIALALAATVPLVVLALVCWPASARKDEPIPHGQDRMPGAPLSPADAIKKMTVPDGFSVELVAGEPDIVNPVAMTFDERGRIWITESLEYPRHSAGPGRDRIKVLECTRGDGRYDKITVFADDLNIPSGIAVGHGGVWVANSPDILFLQDTRGTGKADKREVVVTGFGRFDTHELPNSLTWGPDGYLYGLNGVFNEAHIEQNGKDFRFTCALYRIDPRTREFQVFAEGTSNPWGIAWDTEGSAFISACVVDHLWHLAETGYYLRQGGPYPPHTWVLNSIVHHHHQKAAYCGLCFFDSDAYPPQYRERLYMGNIHGGCINVDVLRRDGSSYSARPAPDFLTANDPWFMPVAQKVGPDGCLYVLDWYDRYHCYQDAQRDPAGIDRERGRLYRIRYKNTPRAGKFDLGKESDDRLIERLHSPNIYFRDTAQRLLCERKHAATRSKLEKLVLDDREPRKARMHALWALVGNGALEAGFQQKLLRHKDPAFRAWGVRAAGNHHKVDPAVRDKIVSLAHDPSPDVQLQVAIAARKIEGIDPIPLLMRVLAASGRDRLIPAIVWQNLYPLLERDSSRFLAMVEVAELKGSPQLAGLMPRVIEFILAQRRADAAVVVKLVRMLVEGKNADPAAARQCLETLAGEIESGEIAGDGLAALRQRVRPILHTVLSGKADGPLYLDAAILATVLRDRDAVEAVRQCFAAREQPEQRRVQALNALIAARDRTVLKRVAETLADLKTNSTGLRGQVLASLARLDDPRVADIVMACYPSMEKDLQPKAIELLTQRTPWSKELLKAVGEKRVSPDALNVNQVRRLLASKDKELARQVKAQWGTLRDGRNPAREKVVAEMREFLRGHRGDPVAGRKVFKNVCAQCHTIYGDGQTVGPDITNNGRGDFEQLLSNVFDPSLVIGAGYQATTVTTNQGQLITGLVVEDNPQRIVLKEQGGKLETIARGDIDEVVVSKVSLMPEGMEKQLKPQEIADLFAFLTLDRPPGDPKAKKIPGTPN